MGSRLQMFCVVLTVQRVPRNRKINIQYVCIRTYVSTAFCTSAPAAGCLMVFLKISGLLRTPKYERVYKQCYNSIAQEVLILIDE